jgi:hypothetical protein
MGLQTQRIRLEPCYNGIMSKEQIRALRILARNMRKNTPSIEKKLREAGIKPDPALVYTAAKYYDALDRLAKA